MECIFLWDVKRTLLLSTTGIICHLDIYYRYNEYRGLLEKNFTSVGISGNHGVFMRESYDQYRLFCSGRKNCQGMLFDFKVDNFQVNRLIL